MRMLFFLEYGVLLQFYFQKTVLKI